MGKARQLPTVRPEVGGSPSPRNPIHPSATRPAVHLLNLFAAANSSVSVDWFSFCLRDGGLRN